MTGTFRNLNIKQRAIIYGRILLNVSRQHSPHLQEFNDERGKSLLTIPREKSNTVTMLHTNEKAQLSATL